MTKLTSETGPRHEMPMAAVAVPYVVLAGALGFLTWHMAATSTVSRVELALFVALVLLLLFWQFRTMQHNRRLTSELSLGEAELRDQAFHDPLTSLPNRALFIDRATHALELHRRDQRPLAICFLDLDGFKAVNDRLGHRAGDDLLVEVARRLRDVLSEAETVARFGRDEFAVLLEDQRDPLAVATQLLTSVREPFPVGDESVSVTASVGLARVGALQLTPTVDDVLLHADLAMYVVKQRGGDDVLVHTDGLKAAEVDDMALSRALAPALAQDELTVAFQPVIDLTTGRLTAVEALARWSTGGRTVPPQDIVRVAESAKLSGPLFHFVLDQACAQLARWSELPGGADLRVAVNVSPVQLTSHTLPQVIAGVLARHGLSGSRLCLEIAETARITDPVTSRSVCSELRSLGVRLSLDDFGTGQSTLSRLQELPIDEVKIDRFFIGNVDVDESRRRFVEGVIAFAQRVGIAVVAEGVEREAELAALIGLGCHRAQGFLFSRPVPNIAVDALIRSSRDWLFGMSPVLDTTDGADRHHVG